MASQSSYNPSPASAGYDRPGPRRHRPAAQSLGYHEDPAGKYVDAAGTSSPSGWRWRPGIPWIAEVGGPISSQLRAAGIAVDTIPVDGPAGLARAAAERQLRHGPGDRARPARTRPSTANWYSGTVGATGTARVGGLEQLRRSLGRPAVHPRRPQPSTRRPGRPSTARSTTSCGARWWPCRCSASRRWWPTVCRSPTCSTTPRIDGILWNLASWETLKPGPAGPAELSARVVTGCRSPARYHAIAPRSTSEPLRRSGGIGRRASLRG